MNRGIGLLPDGTVERLPGYQGSAPQQADLELASFLPEEDQERYLSGTLTPQEKARLETKANVLKRQADPRQIKARQEQQDRVRNEQESGQFIQENLQLVSELLADRSGLRAATGTIDSLIPTVIPGTKDWENKLQYLRSRLTKDNLGLLKGVLSDTDMKLLENIASGQLQLRGGHDAMVKGLQKVAETLQRKLSPQSSILDEADAILGL